MNQPGSESSTADAAPAPRPQSVMGRALLLMEPFRDGDGLTLTELARHADLPRSSAHRMLVQLVEVGWLHRRGTLYHLGPALMELGTLAQHHDRIHRAGLEVVHQLHRAHGAAVHLTVLDGEDLVCLEKAGGRWSDVLESHAGRSQDAHSLPWGDFLLKHREGGPAGPHEYLLETAEGSTVHLLSIAFPAGHGESACLTLTHPGSQAPEGAAAALRQASAAISAALAAL